MPDRSPPRLLAVAHGTRSAAGAATASDLVSAMARARPQTRVDLCFLDVAEPTLAEGLAAGAGVATVVVPLLLTTGYHVLSDIPQAVRGLAGVTVARHLGPHPLLVDALVDRLSQVGGDDPKQHRTGSVLLATLGSSRPEAAAELLGARDLLAARLRRPVELLTMADQDVRAIVAAADRPVLVASYLLAEGRFASELRAAVEGVGVASAPLGAHPAVVELAWTRYDEAREAVR